MRALCFLFALVMVLVLGMVLGLSGCSRIAVRGSSVPRGPLVAPAPLAPPPVPDGYQSVVLANGMRISVLADRSSPEVAMRLFYHVGNADEAADEHGLSHLLEHLMFGATPRFKKGDYDAFIYRAGGSRNAMTTPDETVYKADLMPAQLGELLAREADRMQNLLLTQEALENERRIVTEELRLAEENSRAGRLSGTLLRAALRGHPYGHLAGTPETLAKITIPQLQSFYARHYRPGNAHLVIVGCIDAAATLATAQALFGGITKGAPSAPRLEVPSLREWKVALEVESKQDIAPGKAAVLAYPLPPSDDPDAWAILVLRQLLIDTQRNRLHDDLVKQQHSAFEAGLSAVQLRRGGALVLWAAYLPYRRKETAFRMLGEARDRLSRLEWLSPERLVAAKRALFVEDYELALSNAARAQAIGHAQRHYGDGRLAFSRAARIEAVTLADVRDVYQRYVVAQTPTRAFLVPERVPVWLTLFGWLAPLVLR